MESTESADEENPTKMSYDIEECSNLYRIPDEGISLTPPKSPKKDDDRKIMLEPDHPLLAKFQRALKEQLQRHIEKLSAEVSELNENIRLKSVERDDLGVAVYDAQQMVALQYESIEKYENELKNTSNEREYMESELRDMTEVYSMTKFKLDSAEEKENVLRNELGSMNFMYQQISEWEQKLQSDLTVQQRIADKYKIDRKQFTEEKRNLDFLIYKLMTEVFNLENNLDHFSMQLRVMEQERESLATSIASANADIEALESEHKRLMHSWNCVVVSIGHRDKLYDATKKDLENEQEVLQNTLLDIAATKKLNNEQMAQNEQLTLVKGRIDMDKSNLGSKLSYDIDKINNLEKKLMETQAILKQTNIDLEEIIAEKRTKLAALEELRREIEKNVTIKMQIEERILAMLQEQMSNDKVSKYMNKNIKDLRESNRNLEILLVATENKNADICVNIERQKLLNTEITQLLNEVVEKEKMREREVAEQNNEIRQITTDIKKMFYKYDDANKKFEELLTKTGGLELTPVEVKIKDMEKSIQEFDEKNAKLKTFWLRQQSYIISLREDRHKQLNEMNLIKKQTMLLQQRNLKLEDELEELDTQEKHFERNMVNLKFKIDQINKELWKKRERKEAMDTDTSTSKVEYVLRLKDAELNCIQLEDTLAELEEEKNNYSKELIELNREALAWEKKVKLADETKQTIKKEQSSEGETGAMKAEIHRMTVRYSQLRKAQEKLVHDLGHCVARREFIFTNAEATEKRISGGGKVNNRINVQRKLEDLKSKVKKTENERKCLEKKINHALDLQKQLHEQITENDKNIEDMAMQLTDFINNMATARYDRQKELEILIFKQHKLRSITSIGKGQYRPQYRSEATLENEFSQQQDTNGKLQTVVENLIIDFPNHYPDFIKILNTLKVVAEN